MRRNNGPPCGTMSRRPPQRAATATARAKVAAGRSETRGRRGRLSSVATAMRLLKAFSEDEVEIGIALFRLGALVRRRMNVSNQARPYLYDLREKINESLHLAILDDTEMMCVYNLEGTHAIRMRSDIGVRKPAYCTAEGQAILAFQPNEVVDRVIEAGLKPRTPKTITSAEKF